MNIENPRVFKINREKSHSSHNYYTNGIEWEKSLNGEWDFLYYKNIEWTKIEVPGHMELQGYGNPQYVNTMYPWDGKEQLNPGDVPKENPYGIYKRQIDIPKEWRGKKVYVTFEGVESNIELYCNGKFVGYGEDSFTPNKFELTSFLNKEENILEAKVYKWCSGSWLEDQDFWRFSGIFRDVYLSSKPEVHIEDIFIQTELSDSFDLASIKVELDIESEKITEIDVEIEISDNEDNWKKITKKDIRVNEKNIFEIEVQNPKLWSAEIPNLYNLEIKLIKNSIEIEKVIQKIGIRKIEIKNRLILFNGKRIVFKGVNRHEFSCYKGRAITEEEMLFDIKFLKENNFNAVRSSHYPNKKRWYELCDEYGLYVVDEVNLETHGTWQILGKPYSDKAIPNDDPKWLDNILDRAESMFNRNKNHPSIVIWSCGNEAYGGENMFKLSEYLREVDKSRIIHYEGIFWDRRYNETSDVESRMYAKVWEIEEYLNNNPEKPFVLCEYSHAMGNSNGNLYKYTELEEKYEMYQGGFIWDYIDQSIMINENGEDKLVYGGYFDDRPTDYNFCVNGIIYGDRKPSPKVQEIKYLFTDYKINIFMATFVVENRSLFTNLSKYDVHIKLLKNGVEIFKEVKIYDLNPQCKGEFKHYLGDKKEVGEYTIEVAIFEKENQISFGQYIYTIEMAKNEKKIEKPLLINGDYNIGVKGEGFEFIFSKPYEGLISMKYGGNEHLEGIVKPNFWRAPTDNDRGYKMPFEYSQWKIASLYPKVKEIKTAEVDNFVKISYIYELPTNPKSECTVNYSINGAGEVEIEQEYVGIENLSNIPVFGMSYRLKKEFDQIKYYGLGPEENYIDRRHGAKLGIYETDTKRNYSNYIIPQECGNRTGVRWVEITDEKGKGIKVQSETPFEFSALGYTAQEVENANYEWELPKKMKTVLNINKVQMGVGGDDSWGAKVHDEFLIPSNKDISFKYKIAKK